MAVAPTSCPPADEPADAELLARARAGDPDAFGALVDRHKDALLGYLVRLTASRARAEDLAQESFVRLYTRGGAYREEGKLLAYLYRIATNLLRSEQRRERRWRRLATRFLAPGARRVAPEPPQERAVLAREATAAVRAALAGLPLRYRVPLVLYELEEWSYPAIADHLGCREGTVKSRIHRGRRRLEASLAPLRPDGGGRRSAGRPAGGGG